MGDDLVALQETIQGPTSKGYSSTPLPMTILMKEMQPSLDVMERDILINKRTYLMKEHRPHGEWWENLILHQHDEEKTHVK